MCVAEIAMEKCEIHRPLLFAPVELRSAEFVKTLENLDEFILASQKPALHGRSLSC